MIRHRLVLASTLLASALACVYLILGPPTQDLAGATFRADLFADHGFVIWNNAWYSGHYVPSYSVLYPPLGALLGARLAGAVAAVAAAAVFAALAERRYGDRAALGSLWFAAGVSAWLFTGRMAFLLAVPLALAALLPSSGRRLILAGALAALASLASPVAGLFMVLVGVALGLAGERARGLALAIGGAIPIAILNFAFPTGGEEPFVVSSLIPIPLLAIGILWLVPAEHRALRIGAVLYVLLALVLFVVPDALGGNVIRLGALFAGPTIAIVLWPRGRLVVAAVSLPLLYWQLVAPVRDVVKAAGDPATERAYFEPLNAELDRLAGAGAGAAFRIEVTPTRNRWEAAYVAPQHPIARGWLRQLESDDFDLFTDGTLTAAAYRDWLERHGVSYVAVPDAGLDYLAEDEVALVDSGPAYLRPVWQSEHWRLYRVAPRDGLDAAGIDSVGPDRVTLSAREPGPVSLPVNWTTYWSVAHGDACVSEGEDDRTVVEVGAPGAVELRAQLGDGHCSD